MWKEWIEWTYVIFPNSGLVSVASGLLATIIGLARFYFYLRDKLRKEDIEDERKLTLIEEEKLKREKIRMERMNLNKDESI